MSQPTASTIVDFRSGRPLSRVQALRRMAETAAASRFAPGTRCRAVGSDTVVTVLAPPDGRGNHPVRLALADGRTRDFTLPAISLTAIGEQP